MEARILAGIIRYKQLDKYPKDLVNSYSNTFKTALNLYRKVMDEVETPHDLMLAAQVRRSAIPDTTYVKLEELILEACAAQPAPGELIREDYLAGRLNTLVSRYTSGEELILESEVEQLMSTLPPPDVDSQDSVDDIAGMLALQDETGQGIKWGIPELNTRVKPMSPGELVVIGGDPGKGKTSLVASLLLKGLPKDKPGKLLWLNNEGPSPKIRLRCISALTGMSETKMHDSPEEAQAAYDKARGQLEVKVQGVHGMTWRQVSDIIRKERPTVAVLDMIDHIKAPDKDRRDLSLEYMYQDARQLANMVGCVVVATTQLTAPGDKVDTRFPTESRMKDSKAGKGGAATTILLMGWGPGDPPMVRFLSFVKTKSPRDGARWSDPVKVNLVEATCTWLPVT